MAIPKKVAALVTEYSRHSHADVIVGKIIEGYNQDGGAGPNLKVASLYVDQPTQRDMYMASDLAGRYGFTLYDTIAGALTLGGSQLAVDGVVITAEYGPYPTNANGQTLYPKRVFFEEIFKVFTKSQRAVPVFNSKHLATTWADAKWIYDQAKALGAPLMAGSVMPLTWRQPPTALPLGSPLVQAVVIYHGYVEAFGIHALEVLQCQAERRQGGETGVAAVRCLQGPAMWQTFDQGGWPQPLLDAALALEPYHSLKDYRAATSDPATDAALFFIEYRDGLKAVAGMLTGWVLEGDGGAMIFTGRVRGQRLLVKTQFVQQLQPPFGQFAQQVRAIDFLLQNGQVPYPVERTLLTTGMLDALMVSRARGGQRIETPQLAISYPAGEWPFVTGPMPPETLRAAG